MAEALFDRLKDLSRYLSTKCDCTERRMDLEKRQRIRKAQVQEEIKKWMAEAKSVVFVDFRGVSVADDTKLRKAFRDNEVQYKVVKNTLTQRAVDSLGWEGLTDVFKGPTAIAFSATDAVAPAKVISGFRREIPALDVKGGVLDGRFIDANQVTYLGTLPSRDELLAKVAGAFQGPMVGFASVLNATLSSFARAVDALRQKRESGE